MNFHTIQAIVFIQLHGPVLNSKPGVTLHHPSVLGVKFQSSAVLSIQPFVEVLHIICMGFGFVRYLIKTKVR